VTFVPFTNTVNELEGWQEPWGTVLQGLSPQFAADALPVDKALPIKNAARSPRKTIS
jgi:hypothetical protein